MSASAPEPPEPPPESTLQPDGSRNFVVPDGSGEILRYSRRPDGSWRKPERVTRQARHRGASAAKAAASGGTSAVSVGKTALPIYSELKQLLAALSTEEDRGFVLKIEEDLEAFVSGCNESARSTLVIPPINAYFRRLVHLCCRRFGLASSSSSHTLWGLNKEVEVSRCASSAVPALLARDFIPASVDPSMRVWSFPLEPPLPNLPVPPSAPTANELMVESFARSSSEPSLTDATGKECRGRGTFHYCAPAESENHSPKSHLTNRLATNAAAPPLSDGRRRHRDSVAMEHRSWSTRYCQYKTAEKSASSRERRTHFDFGSEHFQQGAGSRPYQPVSHPTWRFAKSGTGTVTVKARSSPGCGGLRVVLSRYNFAGCSATTDMYEICFGDHEGHRSSYIGRRTGRHLRVLTSINEKLLANGDGIGNNFTTVWVAISGGCLVAGLGTLFEREVMRCADTSASMQPLHPIVVGFCPVSGGGRLELRDIYIGKPLSSSPPAHSHIVVFSRQREADCDCGQPAQNKKRRRVSGLAEELSSTEVELRSLQQNDCDDGCGDLELMHAVCKSASSADTSDRDEIEHVARFFGWRSHSLLQALANGLGNRLGFPLLGLRTQKVDVDGTSRLMQFPTAR